MGSIRDLSIGDGNFALVEHHVGFQIETGLGQAKKENDGPTVT